MTHHALSGPGARRHRIVVAGSLALVLATTGGGCPFDTREPVEPPGGSQIPPECQVTSATQPGDVLRNMETAFGCADVGVSLFRSTLAPFFDFEAPDEDASVQGFVDAWETLTEPREGPVGQFTQHMGTLPEGTTVTLVLDADDGDEVSAPGGDGFVFEDVPYSLDFSSLAHFEGEADIFVRLEGTDYATYRWVDFDQGFPTMARFWFSGTDAGQ